MAFGELQSLDSLYSADIRREGITLTAAEVRDVLEEIPNDDDILDKIEAQLATVDVRALKISKKAQDAIMAALGLEPADGWPQRDSSTIRAAS